MNINKPSDLLNYNYKEIIDYLLKKYGKVPKNYFINDTYKSKNVGNTRTKEGLYIHHIDEDKAIMLSNKEYAKVFPWEYQLADRLVYCNLLEHLILHIKISIENKKPIRVILKNESIIWISVGIGGIYNFIVPQLNDIYSGINYKLEWQEKCKNVVVNYKECYLKCLEFIIKEMPEIKEKLYTSFNNKFGVNKIDNRKIYKEIERL